MKRAVAAAAVLLFLFSIPSPATGQGPRARELGVPFEGTPGPLNAVTDVEGVLVGHETIIQGEAGPLVVGEGPVRTGVTAIFPRGPGFDPVFAGWYSLNGNGEMTGTNWVEESGFLEGPVMITNTHSVGVVRDAVLEWMQDRKAVDELAPGVWWGLPVVAETWDGTLNDINGFHVRPEHGGATPEAEGYGSIIVVVATDAPLLPHQLKRLARRVPIGIGRMGGYGSNGSGDIFIAFSTANEDAWDRRNPTTADLLPNDQLSPFFLATALATEEAIVNAMVAAETMEGTTGTSFTLSPTTG